MKGKIIALLLITGIALLIGCTDSGNGTQSNPKGILEGVSCDAGEKCPFGYECASFPDLGTRCYPVEKSPCDFVGCPPGKECVIAESYPVQVHCN